MNKVVFDDFIIFENDEGQQTSIKRSLISTVEYEGHTVDGSKDISIITLSDETQFFVQESVEAVTKKLNDCKIYIDMPRTWQTSKKIVQCNNQLTWRLSNEK